jgi:hypothetical protein
MANRIILMILIIEVFTHKCFGDNYHKIAYTSKHINIVEITFYNNIHTSYIYNEYICQKK